MPSQFLRPIQGRMCEWCWCRPVWDNHHLIFKSHGGTDQGFHEDAPVDANGNVIHLCRVCHDAAHGKFTTDGDGFNCLKCPHLAYCEAGKVLARRKGK